MEKGGGDASLGERLAEPKRGGSFLMTSSKKKVARTKRGAEEKKWITAGQCWIYWAVGYLNCAGPGTR